MLPFPEHPLRHAVNAELHARNFDAVRAPARILSLTYLCGERGSGRQVAHLRRLLSHFDRTLTEEPGAQLSQTIDDVQLRWERHTEFVTLSLTRMGDFEAPFSSELFDWLPQDWLEAIPGQVVTAVLIALESAENPEPDGDALSGLFGGNALIGAKVAGGAGRAYSDMRIHADGFGHLLLRNHQLSDDQAGRLVKRVIELNTYRALALLGLPEARNYSPVLTRAGLRLARVAADLCAIQDAVPTGQARNALDQERALLAELTDLAAEIESIAAKTSSRFDATEAYYGIIRQRLQQLRQERIQGLQTFTEFLDARLAPAVATCSAAKEQQESLALRAERLTALLRARVEVGLQEQNQKLLDSMDRRARLQLRLQETVEGLSVVAISYYGIGLLGYLAKGLSAAGVLFQPNLAIGAATPFVIGLAWLGLRRLKRRIHQDVSLH